MLDLNDIRTEFASFLAKDPTKWRMDAALAHVVQLAYRKGLADAKASPPRSAFDTLPDDFETGDY